MTFPPAALAVLAAVTLLLWVGAVLLWVQTFRAPENVPVRILAVCITLLAATSVLRGAAGGAYLPLLANNVLGVMTAAIQICFFVSVDRGRPGTARIRGELLVAAAVCVLAAVVHLASPPSLRPLLTDPSPTAGGTPAVVFSAPVLVYLGYAAGAIVYWIARIMPVVVRRVLRFSLWLVAAGGALQVVAAVLKLVSLGARYAGTAVPASTELLVGLLVSLGFLTLVLGALVPLADGAVREIPRIRAQRRANRALEPLWRALHGEFPELALELRSPGPGRALYRRVVEIRDGLVLLSPWFDAEVAERAAGGDGGGDEAAVQAALVREALVSRRGGRAPAQRPASLGPEPGPDGAAQDWQDDAAALVRLARRFADPAPA